MEMLWTAGLLVASPLLALTGLACLLGCRGKSHGRLAWAWGILAGSLVLSQGGGLWLQSLGLAWRSRPNQLLGWAIWLSWLGVNGFTLGCLLPLELPDLAPVLRRCLKGAVLVCAALSVTSALTFGGLILAFSGTEERVIRYQGQVLVEETGGFLDPEYNYYVYHGPLVRGSQSLYGARLEPLREDAG